MATKKYAKEAPAEILAVFGKIQSGLARAGNEEGDYKPSDLNKDLNSLNDLCGCLFIGGPAVSVGDGE